MAIQDENNPKQYVYVLLLLFWDEWIFPYTLDWKSWPRNSRSSHLSWIQARRAASSLTVLGQKRPVSPSQDSFESFSGKSFLRFTVSNSENERSQLKGTNKMHFLLTLYGFPNFWTNDVELMSIIVLSHSSLARIDQIQTSFQTQEINLTSVDFH